MSEVSHAKPPRSRPAPAAPGPGWAGWLADAALIVAFLGLTFLLGVFPLKDTDFWWHLRTGDWIRAEGRVPTTDLYTFTVPDRPWIDLHWGFEVALSLGYELGGVVGLNLAKCAIAAAAMLLLITARRRTWPVWVMVLAWMPALFVLSGRMYIRPETITLLYLSMFLAILLRWKERPRLAFLLPIVQLFWVNTQGLFILGPIVLAFALLDAALTPGAFATSRRRWWETIGIVTVLTGLACLFNPYGLRGALFPLELAGTMRNPIFSERIAELKPIPEFIEEAGLGNVPLRIHIATMAVGALSFLLPLVWRFVVGLRRLENPGSTKTTRAKKDATTKEAEAKPTRTRRRKKPAPIDSADEAPWRLSPFRVLLFGAFSVLSLQATRNSHQFAAVVGTVTAWNFGEWAAAIRRRRADAGKVEAAGPGPLPRVVAFAVVLLAIGLVGSGGFFALTGEGRTVGLGEEPLWFPHEAIAFAGRPGMPPRFLGFHIGHPSLYEYQFGPERKTYADARLEVIGADLFGRYVDLQERIGRNEPGWDRALDEMGRPVILADNAEAAAVAATLLASARWVCAYFDPIAAVFLHEDNARAQGLAPVDFEARHFRPEPEHDPGSVAALIAASKALLKYSAALMEQGRVTTTPPLIALGMDYARRAARASSADPEGWKLLGQFERTRDPLAGPTPQPRFRSPFDPVLDISAVRATFAFREALRRKPRDFLSLLLLAQIFQSRGMAEEVPPLLDRLLTLPPINRQQVFAQAEAARQLIEIRAAIEGGSSDAPVPNRGEHERRVHADLAVGRVRSAADRIERDFPSEARSWEVADRLATLRLHLGEPDRARDVWQAIAEPPRPALRSARVAASYLAEGDFGAARRAYREALDSEHDLFEALYGLAVLELDLGRAAESLASAKRAVELAPDAFARSSAEAIVRRVETFAGGGQG